jgi:hypothetical protein
MPIDLAASYIGRKNVVSHEHLGDLMRGGDGKTYMVDKTGHAWQLSSMTQQRGGADEAVPEQEWVVNGQGKMTPVDGTKMVKFLARIRWATIEDPSTAQILDDKHSSGVRALTPDELKRQLPRGLIIKHPYAYAMPVDRVGQRDYCARKEPLISLIDGKSGSPTLRDFLDLVHCMTLHYKGGHGVYLKTSQCQPKVWAAHLHKMLAFAGVEVETDKAGNAVWKIKCKSISQPTEYLEDIANKA